MFIDGSNLHLTPEIVQEAMASEDALGPTPIIATFDPKIEKNLGVMGYYAIKAKEYKNVKTALTTLRGGAAEKAETTAQSAPEMWKDAKGRTMRAAYVSSTTEEVTVRLRNGKLSTLKIADLSEASQERIAQLAKK